MVLCINAVVTYHFEVSVINVYEILIDILIKVSHYFNVSIESSFGAD